MAELINVELVNARPSFWGKFMLIGAWMLFIAACPLSVWACPDCKDNLSNQPGNLPLGFALSIGLMLAAPAMIGIVWTFTMRRLVRSPNLARWQ